MKDGRDERSRLRFDRRETEDEEREGRVEGSMMMGCDVCLGIVGGL